MFRVLNLIKKTSQLVHYGKMTQKFNKGNIVWMDMEMTGENWKVETIDRDKIET